MVRLTDLKGQTRMSASGEDKEFEEIGCVDTSKAAR